jgi:hypothetical protein
MSRGPKENQPDIDDDAQKPGKVEYSTKLILSVGHVSSAPRLKVHQVTRKSYH